MKTAIITPSPSETAQGIGNHGETNVLVSWCPSLITSSSFITRGLCLVGGKYAQVGKVNPIGGGGQLLPDVWGLDALIYVDAHGRVFW